LKTLKAVPSDEPEAYRVDKTTIHLPSFNKEEDIILTALAKLRKHIFIFRNRRAWGDALHSQCLALNIMPIKLSLDMPVRWNSTYDMLHKALKLQGPITAHCASQQLDKSIKDLELTVSDWSHLHDLLAFFKIFVRPSKQLQAEEYPTLNKAIPQYLRMIAKLKVQQAEFGINSLIGSACTASISKLEEYYTLATSQKASHSVIATLCDPRLNWNVFDILWTASSDDIKKRRARKQWEECYAKYNAREQELKGIQIQASIEAIDKDEEEPDSEDELYIAKGNLEVAPEWSRWLKEPAVGRDVNILKYWQGKQYEYPVIAAIARDHLAIPATSAPSERVFSAGSDIVTKKRNRLAPGTVRELLCLRDWGIYEVAEDNDSEGEDDISSEDIRKK
jgi:hypothetical protein